MHRNSGERMNGFSYTPRPCSTAGWALVRSCLCSGAHGSWQAVTPSHTVSGFKSRIRTCFCPRPDQIDAGAQGSVLMVSILVKLPGENTGSRALLKSVQYVLGHDEKSAATRHLSKRFTPYDGIARHAINKIVRAGERPAIGRCPGGVGTETIGGSTPPPATNNAERRKVSRGR